MDTDQERILSGNGKAHYRILIMFFSKDRRIQDDVEHEDSSRPTKKLKLQSENENDDICKDQAKVTIKIEQIECNDIFAESNNKSISAGIEIPEPTARQHESGM
jgi:hypothetical protein